MEFGSDGKENYEFEFDDDYLKSKDQDNNFVNTLESTDNNLEDHTEDATLYDITDKLPTESNNIDTNLYLHETDNSEKTQRSQPGSERSKQSPEIETDNAEFINLNSNEFNENQQKMDADPFYLPSEFPTLPESFDIESFPLSYRENSMKEELCLEFVNNFKRQYRHLYGDRKPLFIKPLNECSIEKLVCTTINPTKLPYPEVYYWEGAAKFVSDYLSLVPLVPCTEIPSRLLSPMTAISLQRGTCFEYSTLLCSLLIGVGYNAYVVSGYASKEICLMDQSRTTCPSFQINKKSEEKVIQLKNNKYSVRPPKHLVSQFELEQIAKKERFEFEEKLRSEKLLEEKERLLDQPRDDPLFGQRVHSWVLVLAGKREIGENFFIEASTGKAYSVDCKQYLGIESLWNNKNYWVNMQLGFGVDKINFDLSNSMFWEFLLPGQQSVTVIPPVLGQLHYDPGDEDQEKHIENEKYFDLPSSWAKSIQISLKDFEQRSSNGRKETLYKKVKLETYSPYQNVDGMIVRCKKYQDRMLTKPLEFEEFFQNRHDKLVKRLANPLTGLISEFFEKGRKSRLSEHHFYLDKMKEHTRTMIFYSDTRVDHLIKLENSERQLITTYSNRDDFLIKRISNFKKKEKKFGPANEREYRRPFEIITEEYSRNTNIVAYKDIHEIIFHLNEDRISVSFHVSKDNIAGDMVELIKTNLTAESRRENVLQLIKDSCTYFQVDPFREKLTECETYEYYNYLLEKEEASKESIRNEENEMMDILKLRDAEDIENKLDVSLFDRVRNENANKIRTDLENAIEEDKHRTKDAELDYLEPFLLQMNINKDDEITKEYAIKLYTKCIQDFKERLINKANLLQARFEKETVLLQEKQQWYQQNQNKMLKQDEEEYLQFCNESTFRINTLEKMLARHKQISKYKESDLDKKLKNDKRLNKSLVLK